MLYGFRKIRYTSFIRHPTFLHSADKFWGIYKRSTCAVERRRSQLLALLCEGKSYREVLEITRYSYQGADKVMDAYVAQGLEGIKDQRHSNRGAPTLLSDADLLLLAQSIRADVAQGGVWNGNRVQAWVKTTLQKDLYLGRCYEFLEAVGYSQQVPRPRQVEADQERQEDFKKQSSLNVSRQWKRVLKALDGGSKSGAWMNTESA